MRIRESVFTALLLLIGTDFSVALATGAEDKNAKAPIEEEANIVYYESDPKSWARVKSIVAIDFPAESLKKGLAGKVDVEVLIDVAGTVRSIRTITSTPQNEEFESAVRSALKFTRFNTPQTERCIPIESVGELQFEFEIVDGMGRVNLSHRHAPKDNPRAKLTPPLINRKELQEIYHSSFPRSARRDGSQANVQVMLEVNPQTGVVISAITTHVLSTPWMEKVFSKVAAEAAMSARYSPQKERTTPIRACIAVDYRLIGYE